MPGERGRPGAPGPAVSVVPVFIVGIKLETFLVLFMGKNDELGKVLYDQDFECFMSSELFKELLGSYYGTWIA